MEGLELGREQEGCADTMQVELEENHGTQG